MKKTLLICGLITLNLAGAQAALLTGNWTVGAAIPDGNPTGIRDSQTFSNPLYGAITGVNVDLDITGGFNGDLYGYLQYKDVNGQTATEILLNQVGTSVSNPFGSSGSGFNVVLSDSGTVNGSIHGATGIPTGTWLPDSANSLNGTFGGMSANGTWTLFLADLSGGGGTSVLQSWGLDITAVPEPAQTGFLLGMSGLLAVAGLELRNYRRRQRAALRK